MQLLTVHFLFNLSLLIVVLFFYFIWAEKYKSFRLSKWPTTLYFVGSLLLCYIFAYRLNEEMILDLRIVPFMIGGLYMGLSPLLGLLIIFIRSFYGIDFGFYVAVIFYGLFSFLIWYISPWFLKRNSKQRIIFSVGITLLVSLFLLIGHEIFATTDHSLDLWFAYIVVPPLGVAMISYIMEIIENNTILRQRLVKAEKLEAVEQMGAAISHEIRNPLTSAIGFVQLLQIDSIESEKRKEYLAILKEELESAERVIQDYLTFSKPEMEVIEEIDIHHELLQVMKLLQPLANWNSVKVTHNFSSYGMIKGDRQKFHQCFINVMKNAIESMPDGGELIVETYVAKKQVTVQIQDTGVGMTQDQIARLGEPYYSTKGSKGTGLGVMVIYSIVKAMKGTIKVQSEVGTGTTFQFSFIASVHKEPLEGSECGPSLI